LGAGEHFCSLCLILMTFLALDHCVVVAASLGGCERRASPCDSESVVAGHGFIETGTSDATVQYALMFDSFLRLMTSLRPSRPYTTKEADLNSSFDR
jgi:hypothetical protein